LTRTPPPQDEGELDELVARINAGGEKEARGGLQAAGLGVFPSSIAAILRTRSVQWSMDDRSSVMSD
jgi:hypothetical protein